MNFKAALSKFLSSKIVLNVISVLSFLNIVGYLILGNINAIVYFILIALVLAYFSKNMIIVLGVPLVLVNLFAMRRNNREGLENKGETTQDNSNDKDKKSDNTDNKNKSSSSKVNTSTTSSNQGLPITPLDHNVTPTTNTSEHNAATDESFEVGRSKKGKYNIDYASTVEEAYDDLNKIIGGDGIKNLTADTQKLMKQQLQLTEAMKEMGPLVQSMAPLMKQAQDLLGNVGGDQAGLGNLAAMAKQFSAGAK